MSGELMQAEIAEQPAVLARVLDTPLPRLERPRFVLLAARGSSDHAALYAKYLLEIEAALPAGLCSPSSLTVYGARPDLRDVLLITVSQSGRSPDLVETTVRARECGARTLAVTNAADSPLAEVADHVVDVVAGEEQAVAATKTYTAQLLALYRIVIALARERACADGVPDAAAAALQVPLPAIDADRIVVTGRGLSYPTALEAALKLMECASIAAHGFSAADLLHGPIAMLQPGSPVLCIPGEGMDDALSTLAAFGAELVMAPPAPPVHPLLRPIVEVIPLQRLALHLARERGLDPDHPRGLAKVTQTL